MSEATTPRQAARSEDDAGRCRPRGPASPGISGLPGARPGGTTRRAVPEEWHQADTRTRPRRPMSDTGRATRAERHSLDDTGRATRAERHMLGHMGWAIRVTGRRARRHGLSDTGWTTPVGRHGLGDTGDWPPGTPARAAAEAMVLKSCRTNLDRKSIHGTAHFRAGIGSVETASIRLLRARLSGSLPIHRSEHDDAVRLAYPRPVANTR